MQSWNVWAQDVDQVIASLDEKDRNEISAIRQEIASWPKALRDEIKNYQEFVIMLRAQLKTKYDGLSQDAKNAMKKEEEMVGQLSQEAVTALEKINQTPREK